MRIRGSNRVPSDIPQASLADIAFLLLIFFIATTIFDVEMGIPLVLPGKSSNVVKLNRKNVLTVTSDATGTVFVDGEAVAVLSLHTLVEERIRENPEIVVSIETHPDAAYGVMISILDQAKKANAKRISLKMNRG